MIRMSRGDGARKPGARPLMRGSTLSCPWMNRADRFVAPAPPAAPAAMPSARIGAQVLWATRTFALVAFLAALAGTAFLAHAADPPEAASGDPGAAITPAGAADAAEPAAAVSPAASAEPPAAPADRVTLGVDLVSRYVWRGLTFSDAPCLQPWAGVSLAGFALSTWGSFAFAPSAGDEDGSTLTEVDLFLARSLELPQGTVTATLGDYHYPSSGISYFHFADDSTGGHTIDACLAYCGPDGLPLGLCGSVNIYNDAEHAAYVEANWPFTAGATEINLVAGAALGKSVLYDVDTNGLHFIQTAVTASRPLAISDSFAPTLKVSWILNPYKERVILVAALSL
jgi:hypothetical protein